ETAIRQILRKKAANARIVINDEEMRRVIRKRFFFFCCHGVFRSRSDNLTSASRHHARCFGMHIIDRNAARPFTACMRLFLCNHSVSGPKPPCPAANSGFLRCRGAYTSSIAQAAVVETRHFRDGLTLLIQTLSATMRNTSPQTCRDDGSSAENSSICGRRSGLTIL